MPVKWCESKRQLHRTVPGSASESISSCDDHPSLLAGYGLVPTTPMIDPARMDNTLREVIDNWDWPSAWGWAFPVIAMTAARLGNPDLGIDCLLKAGAKNRHTDVGHNPQMWGILPLYLPGNGSLLAAVSLIAAGDDAPALRWASHPRAMSCWTSSDKRFPPFGQQRIASSAGVGGAGSTS